MSSVTHLVKGIRLLVFDFDGVMTDNTVIVFQDGKEAVVCHRGDGLGVTRLKQIGFPMLVLSTETNPVVRARCDKLGIECLNGVGDKLSILKRIAAERGIDAREVAYVGNDVNDLECMRWAGFPIAVADAHPAVLGTARYVTKSRGGHGAVREIADLFLPETDGGAS
ncbi:MAG: HAD hydrolase family protein [Bacteroidota bacterium]|nr:HAD hydrolase family protein [Bacteroidota bacterium]